MNDDQIMSMFETTGDAIAEICKAIKVLQVRIAVLEQLYKTKETTNEQ